MQRREGALRGRVLTHRRRPPASPLFLPPPPPRSPPRTRSYADAAAQPGPSTAEPAPQRASPSDHTHQEKPKTQRYPPLVVERLPNWPHHLSELKKILGRPAYARPFGRDIRFVPEDGDEYRVVQRYLDELQKSEDVAWHSYTVPADLPLKVAIRGLPFDTPLDALKEEFLRLGFTSEYIRSIRAQGDRPGCLLYGAFTRNSGWQNIYSVTELLNVPGIIIEAWRGRRRPAQCHRCQKFRHSSHLCHRPIACVRCSGPHVARDCPRPRETPATCINCGGQHPANYSGCPSFKSEARNRKVGPAASTRGPSGVPSLLPPAVNESSAATLMAEANPATLRKKQEEKEEEKEVHQKVRHGPNGCPIAVRYCRRPHRRCPRCAAFTERPHTEKTSRGLPGRVRLQRAVRPADDGHTRLPEHSGKISAGSPSESIIKIVTDGLG